MFRYLFFHPRAHLHDNVINRWWGMPLARRCRAEVQCANQPLWTTTVSLSVSFSGQTPKPGTTLLGNGNSSLSLVFANMTLDIFCKSCEQFWRPQVNSFPKKCAYFCRKVYDGNLAKFLSIWETTCLHFSPVRPNRCSYEAEIFCRTCNDLSSFTGCNFLAGVFVDISSGGPSFERLEILFLKILEISTFFLDLWKS